MTQEFQDLKIPAFLEFDGILGKFPVLDRQKLESPSGRLVFQLRAMMLERAEKVLYRR